VSALGSPRHLIRRFFSSLQAGRPSPTEQLEVARTLTPPEAALFWAQPAMDQRHAIRVAGRIPDGSMSLLRAALLHDVGKRHSRTGVLGRSVASALALFHLPVRGRWETYLDHGALGAADLNAAGSDPLVVAFAEHHHGRRPTEVPPDAWAILSEADND